MSTEERLRAALESRAATAAPHPDALAEIRRRDDRRRWTTRLQVGLAAATVAGLAAGAFALTAGQPDRRPVPPATTDTPSPSMSPSPGPVGPDEFVAVVQDGRLVVVDASTGRITRTVLAGIPTDGVDVDLAPDRRTLYLSRAGVVERVDVVTGSRSAFARGSGVTVSPDGRKVAYRSGDGIVVHEVATGATRDFRFVRTETDAQGNPVPWELREVLWHADSTRLWVLLDWETSPQLRLLDPATDRTTSDATTVRVQHLSYDIERRGQDLVFLHVCCYPEHAEDSLLVLRLADGRERELVRSPASGKLGQVQVGPDGDLLYVRSGRLYRFDVDTGVTVELGRSTALARDW